MNRMPSIHIPQRGHAPLAPALDIGTVRTVPQAPQTKRTGRGTRGDDGMISISTLLGCDITLRIQAASAIGGGWRPEYIVGGELVDAFPRP